MLSFLKKAPSAAVPAPTVRPVSLPERTPAPAPEVSSKLSTLSQYCDELQQLESESNNLSEECEKLDLEIYQITEQYERRAEKAATGEQNVALLANMATSQDSGLSDLQDKVSRALNVAEQLEAISNHEFENQSQLLAKIDETSASIADLSGQNSELENEAAHIDTEPLSTLITANLQELSQLECTLNELSAELNEIDTSITLVPREIEQKQDEIRVIKKEKKDMKKQKSSNKKLLSETNKTLDELQHELHTLTETQSTLEHSLHNVTSQCSSVDVAITSLPALSDTDALQHAISVLQQQTNSLQQLNADFDRQSAQIQSQLHSIRAAKSQLQSQESQLASEEHQLTIQVQILSQKKQSIDSDFTAKQQLFGTVMADWNKEKASLFERKNSKMGALSDLQQQNISIDAEIRALTTDINDLSLNLDLTRKRTTATMQMNKEVTGPVQKTILPNAKPNRSRTLKLD